MTKDERFNILQANDADLAYVRTLLADGALPNSDVDDSGRILFLIADDADGRPAACMGFEAYGSEALLRSLAVSPAMSGRGVGRALVAAAEDKARATGVSRLYLLTTTASDFFLQAGYDVINRVEAPDALQRSSQFSELCPASAVCMSKTL
jgi:amino-acid N-acetyltransferase